MVSSSRLADTGVWFRDTYRGIAGIAHHYSVHSLAVLISDQINADFRHSAFISVY